MASQATKRRLARLEATLAPDQAEPLVIVINRIDASRQGSNEGTPCLAVIAGSKTRQGETLRRGPEEGAEAFTARVEARCDELHGLVEVEFRD
tara:strand:- start:434 stop:712 length:279 start_codon:yes stop_codon:yes gene_type:complete